MKLAEPSYSRSAESGSGSYLQLLADSLAAATGNPAGEVLGWLQNGAEFSAQQAQAHGLIDGVSSHPVVPSVGGRPA